MVRHPTGIGRGRAPQGTGVRKAVLWKYTGILLIVVVLMVLYLWEQYQVIELDFRIRRLNKEIVTLRDENSRRFAHVVSLSRGAEITERARNDLNMTYPHQKPIVLIQRSPQAGAKMDIDRRMDQSLDSEDR